MDLYTKNGDKGTTDLFRTKNVSKSDDRIQLVGAIEELNSHLGLLKTMLENKEILHTLEKIQATLETVMAGVNDPYNREYHIGDDKTELLEAEIGKMETLFDSNEKFVLPGGSSLSAGIDLARSVARRAERALAAVSVKFGADTGTKKYMNRLSDYLYALARYVDADEKGKVKKETKMPVPQPTVSVEPITPVPIQHIDGHQIPEEQLSEALIREVMKRVGMQTRINLENAKQLIDNIEKEAERRGAKAVIAICTPEGNPVAVHAMDGAFLVSFEAAMKKAYTSVAVQMPTIELAKMAQPGETFYGVDKLKDVVTFGGGVPIKDGNRIIGGIGVSGGTGEEDHALAQYGASLYLLNHKIM